MPFALAVGLPTNLMLFGVENTMFHLKPKRTAAFSPGDFQIFGRQLLFMLIKGFLVGIAWLVALAIGVVVSYVLSGNRIAGGAVAWAVLMGFAAATVPCVAWAFRRHDVSLDTPGVNNPHPSLRARAFCSSS